ncbi:hypothetical protein CLV30_13212 [Haloactinopolyspora alba]|uniref:Uncharacterized protein n=1 Tax=Haloactinopolyspora alba TaxID=648780 RepID=A0A2P8D5A3_9ACTN|nr:hypothetical protein [Haloactinopolyspora alba]PSK92397.1 hypothetical protein CLV30_13212 [Haloactinopolyspora alba]
MDVPLDVTGVLAVASIPLIRVANPKILRADKLTAWRCPMIGIGGGGNGHMFRASNERNARAFVAEQESLTSTGSRLPKSVAGRVILFVLLAAAVAALVLL